MWHNRQGDDLKGLGFDLVEEYFFPWLFLAILFLFCFVLLFFYHIFFYLLAGFNLFILLPHHSFARYGNKCISTSYVCDLFKFSLHYFLINLVK